MLVLDANIAQLFWRLVYPANRMLAPADPHIAALLSRIANADGESARSVACSLSEIRSLVPRWIDSELLAGCGGIIDVIVFNAASKRMSKSHVTSVWRGPIPEGSFYDLGNDVVVPSPECTFLRMAGQLSICELVAYGNELCGRFAFDCRDARGMHQREVPLTTPERLGAYLETARGCAYRGLAERALQFIVPACASPMEALDEMLLCLPYRMGGYGLREPQMNYRIALDAHAARIAKRDVCFGDLCWPEIKFVIEHQGARYHADDDSFSSDRARVNGLKAMGYDVLELTASQVNDVRAFEAIAMRVAGLQGKRIKGKGRGCTRERLALRESLFGWNARFGRPPERARDG